MSNHTPGPWAVEDPMGFELSIVEANKETYEWKFIAHCTLPDGEDDDFPRDVVEANARLIAAAPALLEACKEALSDCRILRDLTGQTHPGFITAMIDNLRGAIATAEGR